MSRWARYLIGGAIVAVALAFIAAGVWLVIGDADDLSQRRTTVVITNRSSVEVYARSSALDFEEPSTAIAPGGVLELDCVFLGQYNVANAVGGVLVAGACPSRGSTEVFVTDALSETDS